MGVTELELTLQASEFYQTYFGDFRFSLADQLRELVSQARLRVNSMHAPHLSPEHAHSTRARLAYLRRCLDLGADLGCRFLVVHPFHLFVSYEHAQHYLTGGLPVWDALLPGFSDVLHAAEAGGQIIALENIAVWESDATGFFNTPANVGRLLADVDSPHLAMTLDVVHAQSAHNLPPFLDELRDSIVTAHVADLARPQRRVPPGAGEIDWPALLKALAGLPRLHHAVLELAHGTPAGVRDSLDFLRPP
ncbi:MAG: sugar phosphate isomerase/epimerase [Anaerolineales bacterium]|nr:sugar phosphate isomerase/epimerase [Anaerolineales bacterium]